MKHTLALLLWLLPVMAFAGPENYRLDASRSNVEFGYDFDGTMKTGQMPVHSADILIDLDNLPASRVLVTLNADAARAGFIFATEAMKSRTVLHTAEFPEIQFRSIKIEGDLQSATVIGDLTVRGVTWPVTLKAHLFRQRGTEIHDRNNLQVELTGTISRSQFGADGYKNLVGDRIDLHIIAMITR